MTTPLERIAELGLELPQLPAPLGAYVPAVRTGNLVFTAGQLPSRDGALLCEGKVATEVPLADAQEAARTAVINALAAVSSVASVNDVVRIVRMNVFVNSSPLFRDQAKVANGASELLGQIFGQAGQHTRAAIGVAELPLDAPVELDLVVEVRD